MTNPFLPPCPFCGAAAEPDDRFCPSCGRDLYDPEAAGIPPPLPAPLQPPPLPASPSPSSRGKGVPGWAVALMVAGGAALLAGGGWLGYRSFADSASAGRAPAGTEASSGGQDDRIPSAGGDDLAPEGREPEMEPADGTTSSGSGWEPEEEVRVPPAAPEQSAPPVQDRPRERKDNKADTRPPSSTAPKPKPRAQPSSPGVPAPDPAPVPDTDSSAEQPAAESKGPAAAPAPSPPEPAIVFSKTYECSRYAEFHVDPEEALVTVDGKEIGKADRWDGMHFRKGYKFPGPGTYAVKLSLQGYRTEWVKIVVRPEAKKKTAKVDLELAKE